jgi:NAD(P)H-hydrate epimerase
VKYWSELKATVLSTEAVRRVDQLAVNEYGMNSLVLMENAALGCVHWLLGSCDNAARTVILCGRGNNGGDGLAIARHLQLHGWPCHVFLLGPLEELSADNRCNLEILQSQGGPGPGLEVTLCDSRSQSADSMVAEAIGSAQLVIDAMLGSGASGDPRPPLRQWIEAANSAEALRVAIDIPTGIDAETGAQGSPAFHPHATLTFVAKKPAMSLPSSGVLFGEICVLPIGIPSHLIRRILDEASGET